MLSSRRGLVWCSVLQAAYLQGLVRDVCRTVEFVAVGCYTALPNVSPAPNWTVVPGQRRAGDNSKIGCAAENGVKPNLLTCGNALLWGWEHVREAPVSCLVDREAWSTT